MNYQLSRETLKQQNGFFVFKQGKKQVLVTEVNNHIYAIDNRCPHEGYPLSKGTVDGKSCLLTCQWHNWKFDLKSGEAVIGADHVRTYPVKVDGDTINIDLSDIDPQVIKQKILDGIKVAFEKRQYGRLTRELARWKLSKFDLKDVLVHVISWSYDRFEFGMSHAYAAMADWIHLYQTESDLEHQIISLSETIDHTAFDVLRHQKFPYSNEALEFSAEKLFKAVEEQDLNKAEGLVKGAFEQGLGFKDLYTLYAKIALEHYNDFGHSLIYVEKVKELSDFFESKVVDYQLSLCLIRSLVYSTREDLIPEFSYYQKTLDLIKNKSFGTIDSFEMTIDDYKNQKELIEYFNQNFEKYSALAWYEQLLKMNAYQMNYYDDDYQFASDNSVQHNIGWLDFTHALTFSNAVRRVCEKTPELWKQGLMQILCFLARNRYYLKSERPDKKPLDYQNFSELKAVLFDHGLALPIYSSHLLKTFMAVREEYDQSFSEDTKHQLITSLKTFFGAKLKQKHTKRLVKQGLKLVAKDF
jgi:nitrite reductase/ring-hydroxylating ferredoxin subunit